MAQVSKTGEVIEGFQSLWSWWIDSWSAYAAGVATKMEAGTYGTAEASADMTAGTALASEAAMRAMVESFDAAAIYASNLGKPQMAMSNAFTTTGSAATQRTLTVVGPLTGPGVAPLDASRVKCKPSVLFKGETTFKIYIDDSNMTPPSVYSGTVVVTDATGVTENVAVNLPLP